MYTLFVVGLYSCSQSMFLFILHCHLYRSIYRLFFQKAVMTFEDDSMDFAYKCLEGTQKFCELPHKRFGGIFSSSSSLSADRLSPHDRLIRKSIIADCILFEGILVFLKQHITSYVKGGYLMRKSWKMYEKIYRETEELCALPSPIVQDDVTSPVDKHVGSSIYDEELQEAEAEVGAAAAVDGLTEEEIASQLDGDAIRDLEQGLAGVTLGLPVVTTTAEEISAHTSNDSLRKPAKSRSSGKKNGASSADASPKPSPKPSRRLFSSGAGKTAAAQENSRVGADEPDFGVVKRGRHKKRPASGFFAPEVPTPAMSCLEHDDARLRGAVYFGYGLMNIIMSLIPPKLAKLANLFGFHGNRRVGLQALEFASNSHDMKAPLARSVPVCVIPSSTHCIMVKVDTSYSCVI